ncbi:MAG: hypothetical protein HY725_22760 [Candidatus Rokubacteria bacterium]|nr:hypothetical protein [Candidatus Rokubacteria bacterium]
MSRLRAGDRDPGGDQGRGPLRLPHLFLPVVVLSFARKPVDSFTFNPWPSRLPEWLASGNVPITRKFEFLSTLALAWFSAEADNPTVGREWGFIFPSLVFGAYFALSFYR